MIAGMVQLRSEPVFDSPRKGSARFAMGAPFTLRPIETLIDANRGLIARIRTTAGVTPDLFDQIYLSVICQMASFVQTLPATRSEHHIGEGGLFRFMLETGFRALQISDNAIYTASEAVERRHQTEARWRFAAFVAGLTADLGRTTQMVVYTQDQVQWEPLIEPLTQFANSMNTEHVYLHWQDATTQQQYEARSFAAVMLPHVLKREHLQYLASGGRHIVRALLLAVSGSSTNNSNSLLNLVDKATKATISKDQRERGMTQSKDDGRQTLQHFVIDAVRRLLREVPINDPEGPVWHAEESVFLVWEVVAARVIGLLLSENVAVPRDPDTLAEILAQTGVLQPSPAANRRQSLYWTCRLDPEREAKACVRVDDHLLRMDETEAIDLLIEPRKRAAEPASGSATRSAATAVAAEAPPAADASPVIHIPKNDHGLNGAPEAPSGHISATPTAEKTSETTTVQKRRGTSVLQEQGVPGVGLHAIRRRLVDGELKWGQDIFCDDQGAVIIRHPEGTATKAFQTSHLLSILNQKGWLEPAPGKDKSNLHTVEVHGGTIKAIKLRPIPSTLFLEGLDAYLTEKSAATRKADGVDAEDADTFELTTQKHQVKPSEILAAMNTLLLEDSALLERVRLPPAGETKPCLRIPYPEVYQKIAERLEVDFEQISKKMAASEIIRAKGGKPVQRTGEDVYVLVREKWLQAVRDKIAQSRDNASPVAGGRPAPGLVDADTASTVIESETEGSGDEQESE